MTDASLPLASHPEASDEHDRRVAAMLVLIRDIGIARFAGRISAGVIPGEIGYEAIDRFVTSEKRRPFVSAIAHMIAGKSDTFQRD